MRPHALNVHTWLRNIDRTAIGYANRPGKRKRLCDADAIVDDMAALIPALAVRV